MTRTEAIRWLTQDYCCNRAVCELHSQNLCQTENCEIWMAKKALEEPEQKRGRWLKAYGEHEAMGMRPLYRYCSSCNEAMVFPYKYCPNCGAYMRGEQE